MIWNFNRILMKVTLSKGNAKPSYFSDIPSDFFEAFKDSCKILPWKDGELGYGTSKCKLLWQLL